MNVSEELSRNRLPCGPLTVAIDGVCRRKLGDLHNAILDKLSEFTSQEFEPSEAPEGHEIKDGKLVPEGADKTPEAKGKKMLDEGLIKNEVKAKLKEHAASLEPEEEPEPTLNERKKVMLDEAKMKAEVKVEAREHEKKLMGNSKLLQDTSGKLPKKGK